MFVPFNFTKLFRTAQEVAPKPTVQRLSLKAAALAHVSRHFSGVLSTSVTLTLRIARETTLQISRFRAFLDSNLAALLEALLEAILGADIVTLHHSIAVGFLELRLVVGFLEPDRVGSGRGDGSRGNSWTSALRWGIGRSGWVKTARWSVRAPHRRHVRSLPGMVANRRRAGRNRRHRGLRRLWAIAVD